MKNCKDAENIVAGLENIGGSVTYTVSKAALTEIQELWEEYWL